jgi:EAL domain-containing protein (putative c-di-GMP-specific phosphodiesterase class I)
VPVNVRLHEHEADRLASLRSYGVLDTGPHTTFDALTGLAAQVCQAPISLISLTDEHRQWFLSGCEGATTETPRAESVCSDVVAAQATLAVPDLLAAERYAALPSVRGAAGLRAYAGVPLIGRDGLPLGTLCVVDTIPRPFSSQQLAGLEGLAGQVIDALELRRYDALNGLTAPALVPEARQPLALRRALDNHEFVPHFQPVLDMRDNTVTGLEALVRWQHPTRGLLFPDTFLPGLETGAMAFAVAREMLVAVCLVMADLSAQGVELGSGVAINLSGHQLGNAGMSERILERLALHDLAPDSFTLEITETAAITDLALARRELLLLREAGVRVVADDFGVGWSNLTRLIQLPFTGLKIDRELVTNMVGDPVREHMVCAAVALGVAMDLDVVAEGVETEVVRQRLLDLGCHRGQGWLFSKAVPAAELSALLGGRPVAPAAAPPAHPTMNRG